MHVEMCNIHLCVQCVAFKENKYHPHQNICVIFNFIKMLFNGINILIDDIKTNVYNINLYNCIN